MQSATVPYSSVERVSNHHGTGESGGNLLFVSGRWAEKFLILPGADGSDHQRMMAEGSARMGCDYAERVGSWKRCWKTC